MKDNKKIQITNGIFAVLLINSLWVIAIGMTQGTLYRRVGNNSWITNIFSYILGLSIMWLTIKLIMRSPEKNIIEQAELLIGKWLSRIVSIALVIFFGAAFIALMITIVHHITSYLLPDSSVLVIVVWMMIICLVAGFYGIEVVGRYAWLGFLCLWGFHILLFFGVKKQFNIENFFPVLNEPFTKVFAASWYLNPTWGIATMAAALLLPIVKEPPKWKVTGIVGFFLGSIFVLLWPILEIGTMTANVGSKYFVVCMELMRYAKLGDYFQRYEIAMSTLGLVVFSVQFFLCFICFMQSISQVFGKKEYRSFLIPVSIIIGGISYWFSADHLRSMNFLEEIFPWIANPIIFGLPIIMLVLGWIMKNKLNPNTAKHE